jgi:hypothetical protein
MPDPRLKLGATVVALALTLAACSGDQISPSSTGSLSLAQSDSLGEAVSEDVSELVEASTYDPQAAVSLSVAAPASGQAAVHGPPPCFPSITPVVPLNADGDAVPDSIHFDFTGCTFTRGPITHSLSGTIDVFDPLPSTPSIGVRALFTDFGRARSNSITGRSISAVHNGTREWGGSPDTLGHTITGFRTTYTYGNGRTAEHVQDWVGHFTADLPGSISATAPLPAGLWTVAGTSTWTDANRSWSVVTSTPVPMHFDPSCTLTPRLDAGQVQLVATRNGLTTTVTIDFTACGQYTVTKTRDGVS